MNYPKITIITPSFNQGMYLEQTIKSVVEQDYPNLEYFVIDGGSTDNSIEIIKKYEKYITYWVSEKDKGQSDAINKGLSMATGEIVNWLNSDDYYEPYILFKVANAFTHAHVNVVGGRSRLFTGRDKTVEISQGTDYYPHNLAKTIGWARIDQPATFFRRKAIQAIGILDTNLHYLMDRDWWIRYLFLFGLEGIKKMNDILVNFRLHENSKTVSQNIAFQKEHDNYFYALANAFRFYDYTFFLKKVFDIDENFSIKIAGNYESELLRKSLNYYILLRAHECYAQNDRKKAKILLKQVDTADLAKEDKFLWKKLNFRNTYIPKALIQLLRRRKNTTPAHEN